MSLHRTAATLAAVGLVLSACAGTSADTSTTSSGTGDTTSSTSSTIALANADLASVPEGSESVVESAMTDLAQRTGTAVDSIDIIDVQPMTWNDGSLDCPEPGATYTQALVEGYWILLSAGGVGYDYRATATGFVKLCESAGSHPTAPTG